MKIKITNIIFHPNKRVNIIIQNVVSSTFGRKASASFPASITATIMPISTISLMDKHTFFLISFLLENNLLSIYFFHPYNEELFRCTHSIFNAKLISIMHRLAINTIITIFIINIETPVSPVYAIIRCFTIDCIHHHSVNTFFTSK